jgi:hypothetical protein
MICVFCADTRMYVGYVEGHRRTPLGVCFFRIRIRDGKSSSWSVERRFSEFVSLREVLIAHHGKDKIPQLPPKSFVSYFASDSFLTERALLLSKFLSNILSSVEPDPQSISLRSFLGIKRPCLSSLAPEPTISEAEMQIPTDSVVGILAFLSHKEILRVGSVNHSWHRASLCPYLWERIDLICEKFEAVQRGFLNFISRPGIAAHVAQLTVKAQYSDQLSHDMSLSVPGDIHFPNLNTIELDSLHCSPNGSRSTTCKLYQEILEILFADTPPLDFVRVRSEFDSETLKTILGIVRLRPVKELYLTFLGHPVNINEDNFTVICSIITCIAQTVERLDIRVGYPPNWPGSQLFPDSVFAERIGHYADQRELTGMLFNASFGNLKHLVLPFLSIREVLLIDNPQLPRGLKDIDIRFVVDGIAGRRQIDRSNRSIISDVFSAIPPGVRNVRITTLGSDELAMLDQSTMPYIVPMQATNFEAIIEQWIDDWRPNLANIECLSIQGPCTGLSELVAFMIKSERTDIFLSLFPRIKVFHLVNCVSALNDDLVLRMMRMSPFLETLILRGRNEQLTDNCLFKISGSISSSPSIKRIVLPRTRFMSYLGIDATERLSLSYPRLRVSVSDDHVFSGRQTRRDLNFF